MDYDFERNDLIGSFDGFVVFYADKVCYWIFLSVAVLNLPRMFLVLHQGMKKNFGRIDDYDFDTDEFDLKKGTRFKGYLEGDNSDWD